MSGLDTLLESFEISSDSEEGDDDIKTSLPALSTNRFRLSQLPAPPPPIAKLGEISDQKRRATIERSVSGSFKKFNIEPTVKHSSQRLLVLQEIITSEQDYVKDLAYIVQGFLLPLRAAGVCSPDVPVIFSNIELLYSINTDLLSKLNKTLELGAQNEAFVVGEIFMEMANNLLSYNQYCSNHERASAKLARCMKQTVFHAEVENCRRRMVGTGKLLHLPDLLIKPIQRICKYPLLLKELLKYTERNHPDHIPLLNAIRKLEDIANSINDHRRDVENLQMLLTIQRQLDGLDAKLAEPGRFFSREGTLQKVNPRGKIQSRHFILLSDMLIWCKSKNGISIKKNHFQYKGMIRLDLAVVRDTNDTKLHKFQIIKLDTKKIYNLVAATAEEKISWMKSIEELINVWLEVEKHKETIAKRDSTQEQTSKSSSQLAPSPSLSRRALYRSETSPAGFDSQLEQAKTELADQTPEKEDQDVLTKLQQLENTVNALVVDNASLKEKVAQLESTVIKQGKEIRKLKKRQ